MEAAAGCKSLPYVGAKRLLVLCLRRIIGLGALEEREWSQAGVKFVSFVLTSAGAL